MADKANKMSEAIECAKRDLELMKSAMSPEEACSEVVSYIKGQNDSFGVGGEANNPWLTAPAGGGGCCDLL